MLLSGKYKSWPGNSDLILFLFVFRDSACYGKCPELGRMYPHFTIKLDMSFGTAEHGINTSTECFYCMWCPNLFPCLILYLILSQSTGWWELTQGISYLLEGKMVMEDFLKNLFYGKGWWSFLSSQSPMITFILPLPSASLMLLIHGLKLIPWYESKQPLHTRSPCPLS